MYPEKYQYTKEHEWIRVEGDRGTVGITDYAQQQLGDVVYVELPEVGATFSTMDVFGSIESVKAVSELYCPMSGEVVEINRAVVDSPELVNKDPHGKAWLMILRLSEPGKLGDLMSSAEYEQYVKDEAAK